MRLLHSPGIIMNVKKIRRLMRKYGLRCPIRKANPYRRMMKAIQTGTTAPNVVNREFRQAPRKVLLTDISYLRFKTGSSQDTAVPWMIMPSSTATREHTIPVTISYKS